MLTGEASPPAARALPVSSCARRLPTLDSRHEPLPRHRPGRRPVRREWDPSLPPAAPGGSARALRHRPRFRRDGVALPRVLRFPAGRVRARGAVVWAGTFGAKPIGAPRRRRPGPGARRATVRVLAGGRWPRGLARHRGRGGLRGARVAQRGGRARAGERAVAPLGRRRRAARRLRRGRRAGPGRPVDRPAARRVPGPDRLRRAPCPLARRGRAQVRRAADPAVSTAGGGRTASSTGPRRKLVLAVIDSLKPDMLDRAIEEGRAPALEALCKHGTYVRNCVSTFPSVTPVAAATIATGARPGEHHIPSMNWFHRGEERYVEYGSSMAATRAFGIVRSLYDTVYNMNLAHLSRATPTVFEQLDDAGLRTACTTYLIYRGRTRHEPSGASVYRRIAEAAQFHHPVYGARELFYADLFDSRDTGCTSALGMPGQRDQHTGCVGAYLVEHGLFDFLLFSLPDNDTHSNKAGPDGEVRSIAQADRALERIMHGVGGPEAFLEEHAVIVMSDHSQTDVTDRVNLSGAFGPWRVLTPSDPAPTEAELAVCPSARSAMAYVLDEED